MINKINLFLCMYINKVQLEKYLQQEKNILQLINDQRN